MFISPAFSLQPLTSASSAAVQPFGFALPIPVMGAEDGGGGTDAGAGTAPDGGGQQQVTQQPSGADAGFPANTPVSEMTDTQRAAYYKHHNRQSDNKLAAFKGVTPQDVDAMQAKIQELENAQLSATDKALKDAATQASMDAKAAADAEWLPKLQAAQLKSIAAPILNDAERLNDFLEMVNPANFVGENGEIDEGKVATKLKSLFGAQSQQQQQPARNWGQHSGGTGTPATPGSAGKAEAAKRFGSKT